MAKRNDTMQPGGGSHHEINPNPQTFPIDTEADNDPQGNPEADNDPQGNPFDPNGDPIVPTGGPDGPTTGTPSVPDNGVGPEWHPPQEEPTGPGINEVSGWAMPGAPRAGSASGGTSSRAPQADLGAGSQYEAVTREVQDEELVANQLNDLLASDSRYMQSARQRGLAAANTRGGLGGTLQAGASMEAAIRAGLPVATADAQAFRDAAAQNMNALNQFGLANMQREAQLEMANLDAATRIQTTAMTNASNQSIARLQSMTQLQNTALQGEIQSRLAEQQFMISQVLNEQQAGFRMEQIGLEGEYRLADTSLRGDYGLAQTDLQGQYNLANTDAQGEWNYAIQRETNYTNQAIRAMDVYFQRLDNLNGIEMDDAARRRAEDQYYNDYLSQINLINTLFPDVPPLSPVPAGGG